MPVLLFFLLMLAVFGIGEVLDLAVWLVLLMAAAVLLAGFATWRALAR